MNQLLRRSLFFNALFSLACGVSALLFAEPLAAGLSAPAALVRIVGGGLVGFALVVAGLARARATKWAGVVIGLDFAWVLGSGLLLLIHPVETRALVIVSALAVAAIAIVQLAGLWRVRRVSLRRSIAIAASPSAAWSIVGEGFGEIGEWAAPILASQLEGGLAVGSRRTCSIAGFGPVSAGTMEERLVEFDREHRVLEYTVVAGMPRFIEQASNRWSVRPTDRGCEVETHATLEVRWPMSLVAGALRWKFAADGQRVLEDLRHRVEQGRPHPRKVASNRRTPSSVSSLPSRADTSTPLP